jgi:hypothetical protein
MKKRPRFALFAWVEWPCKDITRHEIISEAVCPFSFRRIYWLNTPYGAICKTWGDIRAITNAAYRPRGWEDSSIWAGAKGEC